MRTYLIWMRHRGINTSQRTRESLPKMMCDNRGNDSLLLLLCCLHRALAVLTLHTRVCALKKDAGQGARGSEANTPPKKIESHIQSHFRSLTCSSLRQTAEFPCISLTSLEDRAVSPVSSLFFTKNVSSLRPWFAHAGFQHRVSHLQDLQLRDQRETMDAE